MPRKKGGVNKSAAVRALLGENGKMSVKDIVAKLGERGMKVHPNLVYTLKGRMKLTKRKQTRQRVAQATGSANPVDLIVRVRTLAADAGGIGRLKQLVDILAE